MTGIEHIILVKFIIDGAINEEIPMAPLEFFEQMVPHM